MVILGSGSTTLAFDENDVLEWLFNFENEHHLTATVLYKVGHKHTFTDTDALHLFDIFTKMYLPLENESGETDDVVLSDLL